MKWRKREASWHFHTHPPIRVSPLPRHRNFLFPSSAQYAQCREPAIIRDDTSPTTIARGKKARGCLRVRLRAWCHRVTGVHIAAAASIVPSRLSYLRKLLLRPRETKSVNNGYRATALLAREREPDVNSTVCFYNTWRELFPLHALSPRKDPSYSRYSCDITMRKIFSFLSEEAAINFAFETVFKKKTTVRDYYISLWKCIP